MTHDPMLHSHNRETHVYGTKFQGWKVNSHYMFAFHRTSNCVIFRYKEI